MSDSRYSPPAATVADVESSVESLERPRIVTIGICLLWAEIVSGIPGLVYSVFTPPQEDPDGSMYWVHVGGLVVQFAFVALSVFLTHMSWKGRNWARVVYLVLLIFGLVMGLVGYAVSYFVLQQGLDMEPTWESAVYLLQVLLDIVAIWLLFTPGANAWYRAMRVARARSHFTG
jgi:drug/metabolite transporter (DMT)-like permease